MFKLAIAAIAASFLMVGMTPAEAAPAKPAVTKKRTAIKVGLNAVKPVCPPRVVPSRA